MALVLICCSAALATTWSAGGDGPEADRAPHALVPLAPPARDCDRRIQSSAFLISDGRGRTLARLNADRPRVVGSITKLMTAHLVLRAGGLDETVTVPNLRLQPDESRAGLVPGERLDRRALLRLLLVPSANDAAETLASTSAVGRSGFVRAMNRAARRLGLEDTHYVNPSGMPAPGQRSSARDSVRLARLLAEDPRVRRIARMRAVRAPGGGGAWPHQHAAGTRPRRGRPQDGARADRWSMVATSTGRGGRIFTAVLGAPTGRPATATPLPAHGRPPVAAGA